MNKRILSAIFVAAGLAFAGAAFAAATVSFLPAGVNVKEGQNFNLAVSIDPQSSKAYTVKIETKYPADLLEVQSFNFGSGWMPLSQTGYDLSDAANGVLIKTAGYPGGLSSKASFGTITFKAKKNGTGAIQVTGNSFALGSDSQNAMSGLPVEAQVVITQVIPSQEQEQPKAVVPQTAEEKSSSKEVVLGEETVQSEAVVPASGPLAAAAAAAMPLGFTILLIIVAVIATVLATLWFVTKNKKS